MNLPEAFLDKMSLLLEDEFANFLRSYQDERSYGLRVNTLKIDKDQFLNDTPFELEQIPWTSEGFYYDPADRLGKHPYHEAGLYYIQEPSAMAVTELMDPKPGEKVLDLAAAPGGKTSHIATKMNQEGLLVANEIHPSRAKALSQNVERMGIKNAVVLNETPERLARAFPAFFDRVLLDAPCSGEGMFRKAPHACDEWRLDQVATCAIRQLKILNEAAKMLKPEGILVYSTCTFSPEENEQVIASFLKDHPDFAIVDVKMHPTFDTGRTAWVNDMIEADVPLERTVRIWPHHVKGEGHYIAVLKKLAGNPSPKIKQAHSIKGKKQLEHFYTFGKDTLNNIPEGKFALFGDQLYIIPEQMVDMKGLKVLRFGWHLGTNKKNRFEPSHALALALKSKDVKQVVDLYANSEEMLAYLRGETLHVNGQKGWYLVTVDGFAIGWGKLSNHMLKNHYPKGLRWT